MPAEDHARAQGGDADGQPGERPWEGPPAAPGPQTPEGKNTDFRRMGDASPGDKQRRQFRASTSPPFKAPPKEKPGRPRKQLWLATEGVCAGLSPP